MKKKANGMIASAYTAGEKREFQGERYKEKLRENISKLKEQFERINKFNVEKMGQKKMHLRMPKTKRATVVIKAQKPAAYRSIFFKS